MFGQDQAKKQAQQQRCNSNCSRSNRRHSRPPSSRSSRRTRRLATAIQAAGLGIDTGTQAGALAKLELDIQRGRAEAAKTGGAAIIAYEELAQAQRFALDKEWAQKLADLRQSYADREFAALNDTGTIAGRLAEYDRKAMQERERAVREGGLAMVELDRAQAAERNRIVRDALKEQTDYYDGLRKSITDFTRGLQFGNLSTLSPAEQFMSARNEFQNQLALAQGGDRTAQGGITNVAQTLLEQARSYLGPSTAYGELVDRITSQLGALPSIAMSNDPQVQELQKMSGNTSAMVDELGAIREELAQSRAESRALQGQVAQLQAANNNATAEVAAEVSRMRLDLKTGLASIKLRSA